jgi:3-phenylpropionate/trans-cinnamate dioxygenase ferredoxin component
MAYVRLIELHKCSIGSGTFVEIEGRELAVFRTDANLPDSDGVYVIDNSCPHASGNLSGGPLVGTVVTCPWHDWDFDLRTGVCVHSDLARVERYPARVQEGFVYADLAAGRK